MIPKEFKIDKIDFSKYLVDGELKNWDGPRSDVFSSIMNENNEPTLLGSIPVSYTHLTLPTTPYV